jgi:hypothetical protein
MASAPVLFKGQPLLPGDLLCTHSDTGFFGRAIRLAAALEDEPNMVNHVAIFSHTDKNGIPWVMEGRPGGFGWEDAQGYLRSPWTVSNIPQPKTPEQRTIVVSGMRAMLGANYDWEAIGVDALRATGIDINLAWEPQQAADGSVVSPGHVVCSSSAAYLYEYAKLAHPAGDRIVSPADWLKFEILHKWNL